MTPNQITTLIATNLGRELDIPFKLQLMERVKYWRSRLIGNAIEKDPSRREFFRQQLFVKMSTTLDIPCAVLIACNVAKTECKLPTIISAGALFDYVGGADGRSPFRRVHPGTGGYLSEGRFASMFPPYEYTNGYIITTKADLPLIRVDAIFDDPMVVDAITCACQEVACDSWNTEFPMDGKLTQLVVQSILQIDYNRPAKEEKSEIEV